MSLRAQRSNLLKDCFVAKSAPRNDKDIIAVNLFNAFVLLNQHLRSYAEVTMIQSPLGIILILLTIEILVLTISNQKRFKRYFQFLPAVFWIYFLPMLASTLGILDSKSPIYQTISTNFLPASLFSLLITVDVKAILRLGRLALLMFFAGSLGIVLGAPLVFFLFKNLVGAQFWSGFGALSASWTGGSANMIAVKEALSTPDRVFLPMVVVDTIVPYLWMGMLVAMVGLQTAYDRWNRSDRRILETLGRKIRGVQSQKIEFSWIKTLLILAIAILASFISHGIAKLLPVIKDGVSTYAWTIIVVAALGILFSFTALRKLEESGSSQIGYFILYFVLTSIGAKASLTSIGPTLILILAGFLLVFFHMGVLLLASRFFKAPLFLVAASSQANIGGVASAPIVAEIYQPGLASVGLLLAILGNIVGTYLGIVAGGLCRWVSQI